jgi:hypothetical protein
MMIATINQSNPDFFFGEGASGTKSGKPRANNHNGRHVVCNLHIHSSDWI